MTRPISIENCFPGANVAGAEPVSSQGGHVVMKRSILTENGLPGGTPRPVQVTVLRTAPGGGHLVIKRTISIENYFPRA